MSPDPSAIVAVLLDSGEAFLARGAGEDARRCAEQVLELTSEDPIRARAALIAARGAALVQDLPAAERHFELALRLFTEAAEHRASAEVLCDLGELLRRGGRLDPAQDRLRESLQCSAPLRPGPLRARTLEELGIVLRLQGDPAAAVEVLAEARRIREAQNDPIPLARACRALGNALFQLGQVEDALAEHETSLRVFRAAGAKSEAATALNNIGSALIQLGRNDDAERSFRQARDLFQELDQPKMIAFVANNLGLLASYRGDTREAERFLREALEIREQIGNVPGQTKSLNNLANVAHMGGRHEDAIGYADRSIEILAGGERMEGLAPAWFARGRSALELGRMPDAERAARELDELARQTGSRETECEALLLSAEIDLARGDARRALERAARVHEKAGEAELPRHRAEASRIAGESRLRLGEETQAREDLLSAERGFQELQSQYYLALTRVSLARLFLGAGAHEAAAGRLRAAADSFARMGHGPHEWAALTALAEAEWPLSRRQSRATLGRARALAGRIGRDDFIELTDGVRDDLLRGSRAGGSMAATRSVGVLARGLRAAAGPEAAVRSVLQTLRDLLDLGGAWFRWEREPNEVLGHPAEALRPLDLAELAAKAGIARQVVPSEHLAAPGDGTLLSVSVLGNGDLRWGALVAHSREPEGEAPDVLLAATDLLGFALDSLAGLPGHSRAETRPGSTELPGEDPPSTADPGLIGESPSMLAILQTVDRVAPSDSSVLILGESGTGKELIARALHTGSRRAEKPFEAIACPSIPRDLIEAELFGHEKGAFTGADRQRPGRIELAEGGTLFLDEIGDIDIATQSKLLRFLQEREFSRVGGRETLRVDVRVVAATSRDLEAEIREGRFREDLYYRLSVVPLAVPPLRERGEDVVRIGTRLLEKLASDAGKNISFGPAALEALRRYDWPGNVRELRNLVEYLVAVSPGGRVGLADLPEKIRETARRRAPESGDGGILRAGETLDARLMSVEGQLIRQALEAESWNQSGAARALGITESKLRHRMRRYGLEAPEPARGRRPGRKRRRRGGAPT